MMTEQQILNEIQALPLSARVALLEKISRNVRESFESETKNGESKINKSSVNRQTLGERQTISQRLRGAIKFEGEPPNDEQIKDMITDYLTEKYS